MKHLGRISVVRDWTLGDAMQNCAGAGIGLADAKTDLKNAMWRAWLDFILQKKNEVRV